LHTSSQAKHLVSALLRVRVESGAVGGRWRCRRRWIGRRPSEDECLPFGTKSERSNRPLYSGRGPVASTRTVCVEMAYLLSVRAGPGGRVPERRRGRSITKAMISNAAERTGPT